MRSLVRLATLAVALTLAACATPLFGPAASVGPDKVVYHVNDTPAQAAKREGYAYLRP